MSSHRRRSYQGAPRVYKTTGVHPDGQWKTMWYVNASEGKHFWTWREAIDYALSVPAPFRPRWRREDALGRSGYCGEPT